MNSLAITNVQELKEEIIRLREIDEQQQENLVARFNSPSAVLSSAISLFSHFRPGANGMMHWDYVKNISRFLIPLTLNKTIFRHSNLLVKMVVRLVSKKASGFITENRLSNLFDETKLLFAKIFHNSNIKCLQTT